MDKSSEWKVALPMLVLVVLEFAAQQMLFGAPTRSGLVEEWNTRRGRSFFQGPGK